jgi:hypothetical protein
LGGNILNHSSIIIALDIHKNASTSDHTELKKAYHSLQDGNSYNMRMKDNTVGDGDIQPTLVSVAAT